MPTKLAIESERVLIVAFFVRQHIKVQGGNVFDVEVDIIAAGFGYIDHFYIAATLIADINPVALLTFHGEICQRVLLFVTTERLFVLGSTPQEMLKISLAKIAKTIYPVGFYRVKAQTIHHVCRELINRFHSQVPDNLDDLLSMKGVGRKTANLVIALAYGKDAICVDTHVHRISNRLGYLQTKTPEETEFTLRTKLPRRHWIIYNTLMVAFGRKTCKPVSPLCSQCPV